MDQLGRLLLDRGHDLRVRVAGRVDRDAGGEVEEEVAVDVLDGQALAPDRDDRVRPRQARRGPRLVEGDVGPGLGPGSSVTMCGTGRSPAIRAAEDKGHLGHARLHSEYAEWILAAEYSRAPRGFEVCCQSADRRRRVAITPAPRTPTMAPSPSPARAAAASGAGSEPVVVVADTACASGAVTAGSDAAVAAGAAAAPPTTIAPTIPGCSGHENGYVPAAVECLREFCADRQDGAPPRAGPPGDRMLDVRGVQEPDGRPDRDAVDGRRETTHVHPDDGVAVALRVHAAIVPVTAATRLGRQEPRARRPGAGTGPMRWRRWIGASCGVSPCVHRPYTAPTRSGFPRLSTPVC